MKCLIPRSWFPTALLLQLTLPVVVQAQLTFTTNSGAISIIYPSCLSGAAIIPDWTNGYPVTSIGASAFQECSRLTSVTIGTNVTSIGGGVLLLHQPNQRRDRQWRY